MNLVLKYFFSGGGGFSDGDCHKFGDGILYLLRYCSWKGERMTEVGENEKGSTVVSAEIKAV